MPRAAARTVTREKYAAFADLCGGSDVPVVGERYSQGTSSENDRSKQTHLKVGVVG